MKEKDHFISGDTLITFIAVLTLSVCIICSFLYGAIIKIERSIPENLQERWGKIEEKITWNESQILKWIDQRDDTYHREIIGERHGFKQKKQIEF